MSKAVINSQGVRTDRILPRFSGRVRAVSDQELGPPGGERSLGAEWQPLPSGHRDSDVAGAINPILR